MKKGSIILISSLLIVTVFMGCKQSDSQSDELIMVNVTENYPIKELILQDLMDVEYIQLETNEDFITMAYVQDIGKDVIIVRNRNRSSDGNIYFFDRTGKSLKKINRQGPGSEEYTFLLRVFLDEENNEVFVNDHQSKKIFVYDLSGNFKRSFGHKEGSIFNPVYNYDRDNLICLDYISDFYDELKNRFFIISKQDGSIVNEIEIKIREKKSTILTATDETTKTTVSTGARNEELVRYFDNWIIVDPSCDTIYSLHSDNSMTPFIVRTHLGYAKI